jgi:ArsR family transcriptional regulator
MEESLDMATRSPLISDADVLEAKAEEAARLLAAIANPRRLMILCQLADGERSVGYLAMIV